MEKTVILGKSKAAGKEEENRRWTDSIKEATNMSHRS